MAKSHGKLLLDRFCPQATQGSWIDDIEAEQGWAYEYHGVSIALYHQIGDALEGGLAHAPQLIGQLNCMEDQPHRLRPVLAMNSG
jgi:hypothetical protein